MSTAVAQARGGPSAPRWQRCAPWLIVLSCALAYAGSLNAAFVLDDLPWIVENDDLHVLWPPWVAMGLSFRQLVFYSFAVNHAISGHETWSYHLVNLGLHSLAALTLYGFAWRALRLPRIGVADATARSLALVIAVVWAVHPLNTQAVVYVIQRAEILVGLAYLLTFYCFVRAVEPGARAPRRWYAGAVGAFLLGLASKEVIVTAPLALLLFDSVVVCDSFAAPWRRRWRLYAILAAPFVMAPLAWLLVDPERFVLLKVNAAAPPRDVYLLSQAAVLVEYLRLAVWPVGQNLDHAWSPAHHASALMPAFALMSVVFLGTVEAVRRRSALGWLGLTFFLALAPSSSLFPLADLMVEHRMYLALAPCVALVVLGTHRFLTLAVAAKRMRTVLATTLACVAIASLGAATHARSSVYESRLTMWTDVVAKAPHNPRAHFNLGLALAAEDEAANEDRVLECFRRAVALRPAHRKAHHNIGVIQLRRGELQAAARSLRTALAIGRKHPFEFHFNYGKALMLLNRHDEAAVVYRQALRGMRREREMVPLEPIARNDLGRCLAALGRRQEAVAQFQRALGLDPELDEARANLVDVLVAERRFDDAVRHALTLCESRPESFQAHARLARVLAAQGSVEAAVNAYLEAARLAPEAVDVHLALVALCAAPDTREAAEATLLGARDRDPENGLIDELLETIRQLR